VPHRRENRPPLKSIIMLGKVQARVVRNLEEGFALEFVHEQLAETLEEALPRGKAPRSCNSAFFLKSQGGIRVTGCRQRQFSHHRMGLTLQAFAAATAASAGPGRLMHKI